MTWLVHKWLHLWDALTLLLSCTNPATGTMNSPSRQAIGHGPRCEDPNQNVLLNHHRRFKKALRCLATHLIVDIRHGQPRYQRCSVRVQDHVHRPNTTLKTCKSVGDTDRRKWVTTTTPTTSTTSLISLTSMTSSSSTAQMLHEYDPNNPTRPPYIYKIKARSWSSHDRPPPTSTQSRNGI